MAHLGPILDAMYPGQPPARSDTPSWALCYLVLERLAAIRAHLGPILGATLPHLGRNAGKMGLSGALWGAIAPLPGRYVTPIIPLGAKPNQNSRLGNGLGHLGGTSETTPGGSPQWPVARTPTLQRTGRRLGNHSRRLSPVACRAHSNAPTHA